MNKLIVILLVCLSHLLYSQSKPAWKGKKCAVVLTYDDALHVHLDNAIPLLDSLGMKATFYLTGFTPGFSQRIKDWSTAAATGHELGNHTLFHPCMKTPSRAWVTPERDMNNYTVPRMVDEIKMTNIILQSMDHKTKRTFAFTCGDMKVGGEFFMDKLKTDFNGARAVRHQMHRIQEVDVFNFDCYAINGESGDDMIKLVNQARDSSSLLVFLFHGVGGEHNLNVSLEAHRQLLTYLKQNEKDIWIAPMVEVADHVKEWQK